MLRFFFILLVAPTLAFSQSDSDFGFPVPIDLEARRELLGRDFPSMDPSIPQLDRLLAYRRGLEIYRVTVLEAFNAKIEDVCLELEKVERRVNAAFARGDLSRNEKTNYDIRIRDLRLECLVDNYEKSRYWQLYDTFLQLYRSESSTSLAALDRCYVNDNCRSRQD